MTQTEWLIGVGICMTLLSPLWVPVMIIGSLAESIRKALTCSASH